MRVLEQGEKVIYNDKNAIIVGFMNDGNICIEQDGAILYVSRDLLK